MVQNVAPSNDHIPRTQPRWNLQSTAKGRSVHPILLVCLCLATGLALLGTGMTLTNPSPAIPIAGSAAANEDLVRDFYAAVNEVIQTGVDDALDTLVAPDIAWCAPCPDQEPTAEGLRYYLSTLHQSIPDARISVETVVANAANVVMTRVSVSGFPMMGTAALWGPVDTFELTDGLITSRHSSPEGGGLVEPLLRAHLPALPPAVTGVVMARLTSAHDVDVSNVLSAGPTLIVVEAGTLAVRIASGGSVLRAGRDDPESPAAGNDTMLATVLQQGDAAFVPAGVRHGYAQQGTEPAVALGITLFYVENGEQHSEPKRKEFVPFLPVEGAIRDVQPQRLPTVEILTSGTVNNWPTGPVEIALGRAILSPGSHVVPGETEAVLLVVDAGRLTVIDHQETVIMAGDGATRSAGTVQDIRNTGTGKAIFLVFTVAPAQR